MRARRMFLLILCLNGSILIALSPVAIWAGQTGKISGKIIDSATNEPLPGVNVVLEGTNMGAATDLAGDYVILNVPPGTYAIRTSMIGYGSQKIIDVKVSIDLTTRIDVQLSEEALAMEAVVVIASTPIVQKDLTSTVEIVRSEEIKEMAVQELNDILHASGTESFGTTSGAWPSRASSRTATRRFFGSSSRHPTAACLPCSSLTRYANAANPMTDEITFWEETQGTYGIRSVLPSARLAKQVTSPCFLKKCPRRLCGRVAVLMIWCSIPSWEVARLRRLP